MSDGKLEIAVHLTAIDKMTAVIKRATSAATKGLGDFSKRANAIADSAAKVGKTTAIMGAAIAVPLVYATKKAIEFESAMADVAKVGNLDKTSQSFKNLSNQALDLSKYLATNSTDVGKLYSSLLAGGTAKNELNKVAKIAGEAAVAFDITQEAAGEAFSVMKNAMNLSVDETKKAFDATNAITNKFGGKAAQILDFMSQGGASVARTLKAAAPEMEAFGRALMQSGVSASESGTVMQRFRIGLYQNAEAMKIFNTAGGGAGGMAKVFETAQKSGDAFKWFQSHKFGQYASQMALLAGNGKQLGEMLKFVGKQSNYTNSATKEFNSRMDTTEMRMKKAKVAFDNAAISAGSALLPVLTQLLQTITPMIEKVSKWIKANPELTATIMKVAAGGAALLLAVSGVSFAISGVMKLASGIATVTKFLIANPIVLILVAIATAAYLIYKNWDAIKAFFIRLWAGVKAIFWKVVAWIKEWGVLFLGPIGFIIKYWDKITNFFKTVPAKMFDAGRNIVKSLWEGMKAFASKPVEAIKGIVKKIRDFLPFSPAKEGPLRDIHRVRLIETIAASMKPGPMVRSMRLATAATMLAVSPMASKASMKPGGGGRGGGVNYSPTIHLNGGSPTVKEDLKKILSEHSREIYKIVQREEKNQSRTKF